MNVIPHDIVRKYYLLEDANDKVATQKMLDEFSKLTLITQEASMFDDPLVGQGFIWTSDKGERPRFLEVVGALDNRPAVCLYDYHWLFTRKATYVEARVEITRALLKVKNADESRVEGLLLMDPARGRPVWTGEMPLIQLLRILGKETGFVDLPASPSVKREPS